MKIQFNYYQLVVVGLYLLVFLIIAKNLQFEYLWYDESVQFWISKGLNPDSDPLAPAKGVLSVIENNKYYNMDPGGFGILLHYWSAISNHHIWLRVLPFIFFIGTVLAFIYLANRWLKNFNLALLMGFIPILFPLILDLAFEVRAYSMEILGTVLCVIALEQLRDKLNVKNLILWSCVLAICMTSRYTSVLVVFVASLYVLYLVVSSTNTIKTKVVLLGAYGLPLLASLAYIVMFALRYQNAGVEPLRYLPYLKLNPSILLQPYSILYLANVGICTILFLRRNKYEYLSKYESLLYLTVAVNVFFIILSFMGKHPWSPWAKACISMVVLVLLCFSVFLGELLKSFTNNLNKVEFSNKYYLLSFLLIFLINEKKEDLLPRYAKGDSKSENPYFDIKKVNLKSFDKIFVDRWESPYIRYLFEYGQYKKEVGKMYPENFTFAKGRIHSYYEGKEPKDDWYAKQTKMNELTDYDLLIAPELYKFSKGQNDKWVLKEKTSTFWVKREE